jgi:hypothetical protein
VVVVTGAGAVAGGAVAGGAVAGGAVAGGAVAGGAVAGGAVAGGAVAWVIPPDRADDAAAGAAVVVGELGPLAGVGAGLAVGDTTNQVPSTPWPLVSHEAVSPTNR